MAETVREILDVHGRRYRVGETDRELLGRPRTWMAWAACTAMLATGISQYGFGALLPVLAGVPGWGLVEVCWAFALWALCQAGTAVPVAWLRDKGRLAPSKAVVAGALLNAAGLLSLGVADSAPALFLGYSLLGGVGAGLVYATCVGTVVRWFPDRVTARIGAVGAAFACGGVLFAPAAALWLDAADRAAFLSVTGLVVLLLAGGAGVLLRDPPKNWWPADVDPRRRTWAHRSNRPAIRHFAPAEAVRSGTAWSIFATVVAASAVALFDLVFLADATGTGGLVALVAATVAGRLVAARISDRIGRRRTLRLAMLTGGAAQLVLLIGAQRGSLAVVLAGACLAGLGTSCCYALLVGLVRQYFGEDSALLNFAVLYSAKALGGLVGVGVGVLVVVAHGYAAAFLAAAVLGLGGAVVGGLLSHPGLPKGLLPVAVAQKALP